MSNDKAKLPDDRLQRVHWTVEAESAEDLAKRYDSWSEHYDADLAEVDGWAAPRFTAELFDRFAEKDWSILDAGAGTGWVGAELARLGFQDLHGIDYSAGMLEQAVRKGVYRSLRQMNLDLPLRLSSDLFDAVICVGTLTYIEPACLAEFARIVKPGGLVCFSAQPRIHAERGFLALQQQLDESGVWQVLHESDEMQPLPHSYPDVRFRTTILRVLDA